MLRYLSIDGRIFFWRTKDDQEVDLLIENRGELIAAVEIKSSSVITPQYFSGLRAFAEEHPTVPRYIVADVPESFQLQGLATVLPWREYLGLLNKWLRQ
jgi:predicted AAA+ superfamily ATPase